MNGAKITATTTTATTVCAKSRFQNRSPSARYLSVRGLTIGANKYRVVFRFLAWPCSTRCFSPAYILCYYDAVFMAFFIQIARRNIYIFINCDFMSGPGLSVSRIQFAIAVLPNISVQSHTHFNQQTTQAGHEFPTNTVLFIFSVCHIITVLWWLYVLSRLPLLECVTFHFTSLRNAIFPRQSLLVMRPVLCKEALHFICFTNSVCPTHECVPVYLVRSLLL